MTRLSCSKQGQASRHKFVAPAFLPSRQSGISLIEAMISLLLIAVTAVGLAYVSSRSMLTQRYVTTQNLAIIQMREHLKKNEVTDPINIAGEQVQPYLKVTNIPDSSMPISIRTICTPKNKDTEALFGGDGELRIGEEQKCTIAN